MNYKSYSDLSRDIKGSLNRLHSIDVDLVIGIPRSGMVPAYMIALALNVHCTDLTSFSENARLTKGITRRSGKDFVHAWDAKRVLLVDDSILSGKSMTLAREKIPHAYPGVVTTLAVYSSLPKRTDVDIFFQFVPSPRVFEWNVFHHSVLSKSCISMDGVLCLESTVSERLDNPAGKNDFGDAQPYLIPGYEINTLVTCKPEKYKAQIEGWLEKQGVNYGRLVMIPSSSSTPRLNADSYTLSKAEFYKRSEFVLFIEADPRQARKIYTITGKPVFCVTDSTMYNSLMVSKAWKNPASLMRTLKRRASYLPMPIRKLVKLFIRRQRVDKRVAKRGNPYST